MDSLNTGILKGVPVLLPPASEQRQVIEHIAREASAIRQVAAHTERAVDLLRELRTRLIADVVTGKLDVCEAAAQLPDEVEEPELLDDGDWVAEGGDGYEVDSDATPQEAEA